jgi:hypothetical protein
LVRAAATEGFANYVIVPKLPEIFVESPMIKVNPSTGMAPLNVSHQETEIAIRNARPKRGNVIMRRLCDMHFCLYRRKGVSWQYRLISRSAQRKNSSLLHVVIHCETEYKFQLSTFNSWYLFARSSIKTWKTVMLPCFVVDSEDELKCVGCMAENLRPDH